MRQLSPIFVVALGIAAIFALAGPSPEDPKPAAAGAESGVKVRMRDGVNLAADVFLPAQTGRWPAILIRTPYGKSTASAYRSFVGHGYAVVLQDVRGRYASEGVFAPLTQEGPDGDDTLNWIAAQPWSNGKVGMTGGSYLGIAQWKVALFNNPHLKAIFPVVSGWDDYRDRFYSQGGAMKLGHRLLWLAENLRRPGYEYDFKKFIWMLPVRRADEAATGLQSAVYQQSMDHPADDGYWKNLSVREHIGQVKIPVFAVGGWYDNYVESDLDAFAALHKLDGRNRVLIGPWAHNMSTPFAGISFGPSSVMPIRKLQLEWFDHWLKGAPVTAPQPAPVQIFVMGANVWRHENEWPIARARMVNYYFSNNGSANSLYGNGGLSSAAGDCPPDHFTYDPLKPVQTLGGAVCCNPAVFPWGPMDQRAVEKRRDVLVYSTPPLTQAVEVTGKIQVTMSVASSAPDTDFMAKLVDVFPSGETRNLTDGMLRVRYREGLDKPKLMKPGEVYRIGIDAGVTSNVFLKGHRIRVEVSSSNFPRFDRNLNTGRVVEDETEARRADQTIYHDRSHPSYVTLPVIPKL